MELNEAEAVYLALLAHPLDEWRADNQRVLAIMRRVIAKMTGRSEQEVQEHYENRR